MLLNNLDLCWFPSSSFKAINLRGIQLIYNDKKTDLGGYRGCFCHNFLMQKQWLIYPAPLKMFGFHVIKRQKS